jgi:lipopolysaccharide assembly outer membrane protein LptD (OstA)
VITGLRAPLEQEALNQATAAYAWPMSEKWASLAAYSYNISNGYAMMFFAGMQYDSCCWAFRLMGGRTFQSLAPQTLQPQYNNNIYFRSFIGIIVIIFVYIYKKLHGIIVLQQYRIIFYYIKIC